MLLLHLFRPTFKQLDFKNQFVIPSLQVCVPHAVLASALYCFVRREQKIYLFGFLKLSLELLPRTSLFVTFLHDGFCCALTHVRSSLFPSSVGSDTALAGNLHVLLSCTFVVPSDIICFLPTSRQTMFCACAYNFSRTSINYDVSRGYQKRHIKGATNY